MTINADSARALLKALDTASAADEGALLAQVVPWLAQAPVDELRNAGWWVRRDDQPLLQRSLASGMLAIQRTLADLRAVLWVRWGHGGAALWLDGRAIEVPRDPDDGAPLTADIGTWAGNHVYAIEVPPMNHPLSDWSHGFSGEQYGLLLADARTGRSHLEMPGPAERWQNPQAEAAEDGTWRLFADGEARAAGQVARTVPAF